jgi:hypothetical protein
MPYARTLVVLIWITAGGVAVFSVEGQAVTCELSQLLDAVKPPARFAEHEPNFHVREVPHTHWWWREGGLRPIESTLRVIYDGDRPIGLLHGMFFARYPGADTSNVINKHFNLVHHRIGTEIPDGSPVDRYRDEVHEGREITVTGTGRTLQYTVVRGNWPRDPEATFGARSDITLRVDPVLGYVFERHTQWRRHLDLARRDQLCVHGGDRAVGREPHRPALHPLVEQQRVDVPPQPSRDRGTGFRGLSARP